MTIKIILADDHAIVRDGLFMLLDSQPDLEVVGQASDGRSAVRLAAELHPDVAILDIAMPELNGLEAARQILKHHTQTRVILLSMHGTIEYIVEALQIGVLGYLLKASAGSQVIDAVRAVHAGRRYLSQEVLDRVVASTVDLHGKLPDEAKRPLARLSERERAVLQLVVEGRTSAEIAETLYLSPKTVETYRSNIMKKLGIEDLPGLVKFAIRHGLTSLD